MVLPTTRKGDAAATTPDRSRYEAGKGHVLSHFAELTTPSAAAQPKDAQRGGRAAARRSLDNNLVADFPPTADNFGYNVRTSNSSAATDRDMEDALFGTRAGGGNNEDNLSDGRELSQQQKLERWRLEKGGNRAAALGDGKSAHQQPPKRPKAVHHESGGNQAADGDRAMFPMDFSPPRRSSSASSSRRSTVELDATTALSSDFDKRKKQSAFSASFVSGSEPFSPAVSSEFLSRDLDEEEQALKAKSDKERAHLYKKRYIDTYGFAVMLARRVTRLEKLRADRNAEIDVLRSKVRTQEQIISVMGQNESVSLPGDASQTKQVQSLSREVAVLMQQLGERDSIIRTLHDERDESVRIVNEIKLSRAAREDGDSSYQNEGAMGESGSFRASASEKRYMELQGVVDALQSQIATLRTSYQELAEEKSTLEDRLTAAQFKLDDCQHLYEASEAQRSELSSGLQQTQEQLEQLHAQWTQEKKELLNSASLDGRKAAALAAELEKLRAENATLKNSLGKVSESERRLASQLEQQKAVTAEAQTRVARLESELRETKAKVAVLSEHEKHFVRVESELTSTKHELANKVSRIARLEKDVYAKDTELRAAEEQFHEKAVYMEKRLFQAEIVRRSLHNKVMELKGNIRVFCRVRPVLEHERSAAGSEEIFSFPDYAAERRQIELTANSKSHVSYGQNGGRDAVKKYTFDFDLVFDSSCSQEDMFLEVSALVQSALDGFNVCIFAYGQTGSGKTFTMQGSEDSAGYATMQPSSHMGIVGRAIAHIYATITDLRSSGWEFAVTLEMIEIYNETLRDLLAPAGSVDKVDLRLDADGRPAIANSCIHTVVNELDAWQLLQKAMSKRSTKATSMNDRSSRSHCVISFRMSGVNSLTGDRRTGVVHLVDLAGSERLNKSGSGNDRELLKEAQAINKSLSSLGNVICALAKKSAHVPFRDSKLTHFLSPSLGGDSKTLMICNLSPLQQHREETLNSLRFAKMVNSCEITYASVSSRS